MPPTLSRLPGRKQSHIWGTGGEKKKKKKKTATINLSNGSKGPTKAKENPFGKKKGGG